MRTGRERPPDIPGYTYLRSLGKGGYATVHLYRQDSVGRQVAVKVLDDVDPELTARRPIAEVKAMARFDGQQHIVQIIDARTAADGRRIMIMPYYEGGDLLTRVKERGPLPVAEVLRIGVQIADALATVHADNYVHCDVKPANILIGERGGYHLSDFGIASPRTATRSSEEYGVSIPWSPREVLAGAPATVQSDLYSLGATLWHLLMGRSPFNEPGGDNSGEAIEERVMTRTAPRLSRAEAPRDLEELVRSLLAPDPKGRPRSAQAVRDRLADIATQTQRRRPAPGPNPQAHPDATIRRDPTDRPSRAQDAEDAASETSPPRSKAPRPEPARPTSDPARPSPEPAPSRPGPDRRTQAPPAARQAQNPEPTQLRVPDPVPEDPSPAPKRRTGLVIAGAAAALVAATVVTASVLSGGDKSAAARNTAAADDSAPAPGSGGLVGEAEPPGVAVVTAVRSGTGTLHFTWTYSAAQSSDTFRWQTPDGARHGVTQAAALDLPDASGTRLCVQVKVVRADGSDAQPDWSPEGCGS